MSHAVASHPAKSADRNLPAGKDSLTVVDTENSAHHRSLETTVTGPSPWRMIACALWLLFLGLGLGMVGERFSSASTNLPPNGSLSPVSILASR